MIVVLFRLLSNIELKIPVISRPPKEKLCEVTFLPLQLSLFF